MSIAERFCKTKSFFIRDEPVPLKDFYVPLGVESKNIKIKSVSLDQLIKTGKYITITGYGGSGKSVLLKYLLLNCIESGYKIPIYLELRDLINDPKNLIEFIKCNLSNYKLDIEEEYIEKSLNRGHFIIFLDGLDEVSSELRDLLTKEINDFTKTYTECSIIITTRPDDRISQLEVFKVFKVTELDLEKSITLVEKLPADNELKLKFIADLKNELFEKHKSFLSNPLLLSIMLLTYGYSADIPNKLSIFYNQAYEALFQRHDALKGAYKRSRETELDIQEFERILCSFCIQCYDKRKAKFSRMEALEFIDNAKKITAIDYRSISYLTDLLQAVCILVEDGMFLTFAHRSFQEYFAARFIIRCHAETKSKLLHKYLGYFQNDNLYDLVFEMDTAFIESEVWIPFLDNFFKEIGFEGKVTKTILLKFLQKRWSSFTIHHSNDGSMGIAAVYHKNATTSNMINYIKRIFNKSIRLNKKIIKNENTPKNIISLFQEGDIITDSLTENSDLINYLYNDKGFLGPQNLLMLYEINLQLKEKYKNINDNLESMLKI